jgi:hypothetical protein
VRPANQPAVRVVTLCHKNFGRALFRLCSFDGRQMIMHISWHGRSEILKESVSQYQNFYMDCPGNEPRSPRSETGNTFWCFYEYNNQIRYFLVLGIFQQITRLWKSLESVDQLPPNGHNYIYTRNQGEDELYVDRGNITGCTSLERQGAKATKFRWVALNVCGFLVWNLLRLILLAPRILKWLMCSRKICKLMVYCLLDRVELRVLVLIIEERDQWKLEEFGNRL